MARKALSICTIAVVLISLSLQPLIAYGEGITGKTKEIINKGMFWKDDHLSEISFRTVYPKQLYKKSYLSWVILGSTVVAGAAVTYFTLGQGAPAAATGVSTVASWVAGGGAGSYMAGLSTVGGLVGGNAITGAVILNGLSYGLIGGSMGKFAALSAAAKFGVIANVTSTVLDGVAVLDRGDSGRLYYTVRLVIPRDLGSRKTRKLVDEIYDNEEKKFGAIEKGDEIAATRYKEFHDALMKSGSQLLSRVLASKQPSQEDLLVLGMINYQTGNVGLFQQAVKRLSDANLDRDKRSFVDYLIAVNHLLDGNEQRALEFLEKSSEQEPYALEPGLLTINVLGSSFRKNEQRIIDKITLMEKKYDSDKYSGQYSLLAPYYRVATLYYNNKDYLSAQAYYEKALGQITLIQKLVGADDLTRLINLGIANCHYQLGYKGKASKLFAKVTSGLEEEKRKQFEAQYAGTR